MLKAASTSSTQYDRVLDLFGGEEALSSPKVSRRIKRIFDEEAGRKPITALTFDFATFGRN